MKCRLIQQMNEEAVRDSWDAYWVKNRLRMHDFGHTEALEAGTSKTGSHKLFLTFTVQRVEDENICTRPFWRVSFDWRVVPEDQASPASADILEGGSENMPQAKRRLISTQVDGARRGVNE